MEDDRQAAGEPMSLEVEEARVILVEEEGLENPEEVVVEEYVVRS